MDRKAVAARSWIVSGLAAAGVVIVAAAVVLVVRNSAGAQTTPPLTASPTTASTVATSLTSEPPSSSPPAEAYVPIPVQATPDCSAPSSTDASGQTQSYGPANAYDGRPDTAWRCSGDATGHSLIFTFGGAVHLTSVGLIPGYDKIDPADGADRFVQGRKVMKVQWAFDGGVTLASQPNGERALQPVPVDVVTTTVKLTILQTEPGSAVKNKSGTELAPTDATSVSEVAFTAVR